MSGARGKDRDGVALARRQVEVPSVAAQSDRRRARQARVPLVAAEALDQVKRSVCHAALKHREGVIALRRGVNETRVGAHRDPGRAAQRLGRLIAIFQAKGAGFDVAGIVCDRTVGDRIQVEAARADGDTAGVGGEADAFCVRLNHALCCGRARGEHRETQQHHPDQ